MGLDSFKGGVDSKPGVKWKIDKLNEESLCPRCGNEGEKHKYYWRCTTDSDECGIITYLSTDFEQGLLG